MVRFSPSPLSQPLHFLLVTLLLSSLIPHPVLAAPGLRWAKRIEDVSSTHDAVGASQYCDPQFFDVRYFNESGAGPWYAEWVHGVMAENSPAWQARMSEPQFFALHQLHWMDMDCGVTHKGCVNMPNCDQVLQRVDGNVTLARNIYFVLQSFHNLNLIGGVVSEQSSVAETNVLGMGSSMANAFFWKFDPKEQEKCDLLTGMVKAVQSAVAMALVFSIPAIGIFDTAALTALEGASVKSGQEVAWAGREFAAEAGQLRALGGVAKPTVTNTGGLPPLKAVAPWSWKANVPYNFAKWWNTYTQPMMWQAIPNSIVNFPMQFETPYVTKGLCSMFPNPDKDAPLLYTRELEMTIQAVSRGFRKRIDQGIAAINRGAGAGPDGVFDPERSSQMADQIILGHYAALAPRTHERFVNNPSLVEQDMTVAFKNALISSALKSQMCHIHCSPRDTDSDGGDDPCTFKDKDDGGKMSKSRFCPSPDVICQAQCWRNSPHAKNLELFGTAELSQPDNMWEINLDSYLQDSYDHWQQFHGEKDPDFPSVTDLLYDQVTDASGSFLPVCFDANIMPSDFKDATGDDRAIPCTCGDAYGNETSLFFQEAGFDKWVALEDHPEKLADRCMKNMFKADTGPVEQYMTLCKLGARWPVHGDQHHRMYSGSDSRCDEMHKLVDELLSQNLTDDEITCKVCFGSPVGKEIQHDQRDYVNRNVVIQVHDNMRHGCQSFAQLYKDEDTPCILTDGENSAFRAAAD